MSLPRTLLRTLPSISRSLRAPLLRSLHTPATFPSYAGRAQLAKPVWAAGVRAKSTFGSGVVKYEELKPITEQPTEDILLIDVREPDETALGSIPSAVGLPLSQLKDHLNPKFSEGEFKSQHGFPRPLPSQNIIFFCRSGKRSATACAAASELGYKNIRNYEGSWLDWVEKEKAAGQGGKKGGKWDDEED